MLYDTGVNAIIEELTQIITNSSHDIARPPCEWLGSPIVLSIDVGAEECHGSSLT